MEIGRGCGIAFGDCCGSVGSLRFATAAGELHPEPVKGNVVERNHPFLALGFFSVAVTQAYQDAAREPLSG